MKAKKVLNLIKENAAKGERKRFFLFALKQNVVYSLKIRVENQEDVNGST